MKPLLAALLAAFAMLPTAPAESTKEQIKSLRRDLEELKASQKAIEKNIEIIRLILSGKQPPLEDVVVETKGAPALGASTAKVTLVEFSDYQCPYCARYATQTFSQIVEEYVRAGKLRYVFRNFPIESIHPLAAKAAEAALCAGAQDKYWEMHDRIFRNQSSLEPKDLSAHATTLGLDAPRFQSCLDGASQRALVKADVADGEKLGVRGTPTFFLGLTDPKSSRVKAVSLLSGAQAVSVFRDAIDKLLSPPTKDSGQ